MSRRLADGKRILRPWTVLLALVFATGCSASNPGGPAQGPPDGTARPAELDASSDASVRIPIVSGYDAADAFTPASDAARIEGGQPVASLDAAMTSGDAAVTSGDAALVSLDASRPGVDVPSAGPAPSCAFAACGGQLAGTSWEVVGYCAAEFGGKLGMASGTLTFETDGTYAFVLSAYDSPKSSVKPQAAELGTFQVRPPDDKVFIKSTQSNGASFAERGSLVYRPELGFTATHCVSGGFLKLSVGKERSFVWLFRAAR